MADQRICMATGAWQGNCGALENSWIHDLTLQDLSHEFVAPLPVTHDLKIWPEFFEAMKAGHKRFEIRLNDRLFQMGDQLTLSEFDPKDASVGYTGAFMNVRVMSIFTDVPGVHEGYIVMGIEVIE
jgi:hypothetical protein